MPFRILSILLLSLVASSSLVGRSITVQASGSTKVLQAAIDQAQAFDTIFISRGEYREGPVSITKPLTIIGLGRPVIDGQHKYQPIQIRSNYVSISGLKIINCGYSSIEDWAGIKVLVSRHVYIFDNILDNNVFAIYLSGSRQCVVSGNRIKAYGSVEQTSGNGIHAWKCDSLTIQDNNVRGHRDGIYFEFVTNSRVLRNYVTENLRYGLHFMFSHDDLYEGNTFTHNGAGVAVMYSKRVHMFKNFFEHNRGAAAYGLLLKDISDSAISDNAFIENTCGIFMEGCSRSDIARNNFQNNGWAIKLQASCENNTLSHNNFIANTFDVSTNNSLVLNKLKDNYWDKYEGYDLNKDGIGDVPYRPASLYAMLADQMPYAMMLWRSFCVYLLDRAEKAIPSISPDNLRDDSPRMRSYDTVTKH
jgi:nitrous oxidase accessory protein